MKELAPPDWAPPPAPLPVGPELLETPFPWVEVMLGIVGLLAVIGALWMVLKKFNKDSESDEDPLELAIQAIDLARDSKGAVMASELSVIIRSYLFSKIGDEAIFETSEELSHRSTVLKSLFESSRGEVLALLDYLDRVRYRPNVETSDLLDRLDEIEALLGRIDSELQVDDLSS